MTEQDGEFVDIVDEDCKILFAVPKKEAHEKGLLHRTVIAEIKDGEGRWMLIRQASHKQDASQFVSPVGGHVRSGETEEEALKREVFEEVGLSGFEYNYIGRIVYNRRVLGRQENHYFIVFEIFSDDNVNLNHESAEAKKFASEELKRELKDNPKMFGDAFFVIIRKFYPFLLD